MYDPKIGQFLSEDPIDFDGLDENLRRYVRNRPTTHTDPSGLLAEPTIAELMQPNIYAPPEWTPDATGLTPSSMPQTWTLTGPPPPLPTNPNNVRLGSSTPNTDVRTNFVGAPGEFRVGQPSIRYNSGGAIISGVRQAPESRTEVLIPVEFTDIPGAKGRLGILCGGKNVELGVWLIEPTTAVNGPPYATRSLFTTLEKHFLKGWYRKPAPYDGKAPDSGENAHQWTGCPAMHGNANTKAFVRLIADSTQRKHQRYLISAKVNGVPAGYIRIDVIRSPGAAGGGSNFSVTVYPMTSTAAPQMAF